MSEPATRRRHELREHFDRIAPEAARWRRRNSYYHGELVRLLRFAIPKGSTVVEIGCGAGDLLAAVEPFHGVGVDLSPKMVAQARAAHPHLTWIAGDAHALPLRALGGRPIDFIILSDLVGHLEDVWTALAEVRRLCAPHTRIIVTYYNFVWEPLFRAAEWLRLKMPTPDQNWLGSKDLLRRDYERKSRFSGGRSEILHLYRV